MAFKYQVKISRRYIKNENLFKKNSFEEVEFSKPRIVNLQTPNMMMMIEMIPIYATDKVWQNNT